MNSMRLNAANCLEQLERRLLLAAQAVAFDDQIVFVSYTNPTEIRIANEDGSDQFTITTTAPNPDNPCLTPDRSKIVFESPGNNQNAREIWIIGVDGTGETRLTFNNASDGDPSISPDGSQIVFVSDRDGSFELFTMGIDGSNQHQLTNTPTSATYASPSYSPDAKTILAAVGDGGETAVVTVDAVTGDLKRIIANDEGTDEDPAWSPEGLRVVFASNRRGTGNNEIFVIDAIGEPLGGELRRLTTGDANSDHSHPSFSPDGTAIVFAYSNLAGHFLDVIDENSGNHIEYPTTSVSRSPHWASAPRFSGLIGNTVHIQGTAGADSIVFGEDNGETTFTLNGKTESYPAGWIDSMQVFCGGGNDVVQGNATTPRFYCAGDAGDDKLIGGSGNDTLTGGAGKNTLFGGDGNDRLNGSSGRDFCYGDAGNDRIYGNAGNDYMVGGSGVDRLWGGDGDDLLSGNSGNDKLFGEKDNDQLLGGDGNDLCYGGLNIDTLNGGKGTDSADDDDSDLRIQIEVVP